MKDEQYVYPTSEVQCNYCKSIFLKANKEISKTKNGLHYCSQECYRLFNESQKVSLFCSSCGYSEFVEGLEVHHIDGDSKNNNVSNLMILCATCHRLITFKVVTI